jgi:hypothetical protein
MDFYYPSCIYVCGDQPMSMGTWVPAPTWIVIAKMNQDLEIEFEKYIGGDAHYHFSTVTAASDSGILISATRYDWNTQNYERDVIILKLDMNGCITGIQNKNNVKVSTAIVYPNPGNEIINIRTALKGCIFNLFDTFGRQILKKPMPDRITTVKTNTLSKGTYYYSVTDNNKTIISGTWIKN